MKLQDYIKQNGLRKDWFARKVGVTPQTLHNWLTGQAEPSTTNKRKVYSVTGGNVTPNDFVDMSGK